MPLFDIKPFDQYDEEIQKLFQASIDSREKAYVPYSKFRVGAAVLTTSGCIISGCNVENSAYPMSTCAERTAIVKAVSEGYTDFISMAICGAFEDNDGFVTPCGSCRQKMVEFQKKDKDTKIFLVKPDRSSVLQTTLNSILPLSFNF